LLSILDRWFVNDIQLDVVVISDTIVDIESTVSII